MDILFFVLIGIAGVVALWLVFKLLGGCLVKILVAVAVLAAIAFVIYLLATR